MSFNLLKLFRKETLGLEEKVELICADSHCHLPIEGDKMVYHKETKKLYHPGECAHYAPCNGACTSKTLQERIPSYETITKKQAIKLYKTGQVAKYDADKK